MPLDQSIGQYLAVRIAQFDGHSRWCQCSTAAAAVMNDPNPRTQSLELESASAGFAQAADDVDGRYTVQLSEAFEELPLVTREDGSRIDPNDPNWEALHEQAKSAREHPRVWLEMSNTYGDLVDETRFAKAVGRR